MSPLQSQQQERDFFTVSHQHTPLFSSLTFQAGYTCSKRIDKYRWMQLAAFMCKCRWWGENRKHTLLQYLGYELTSFICSRLLHKSSMNYLLSKAYPPRCKHPHCKVPEILQQL